MKSDNGIEIKSKEFAIRVVKLTRYLQDVKREFVLAQQFLRSGTSIGANVKEAFRSQSEADFTSIMKIALKEASETEYWLEILFETNYLSESEFNSIYAALKEIIKILTSMVLA